MEEEVFEAKNELERQLLAAHEGSISEEDLVDFILGGEVFMPIQDEKGEQIQGLQRSSKAMPLAVEADGGIVVMLVFSSPDRAKPVVKEFDGYGGGLLTEFSWVLEKIDEGFGISINPGWDIGFDIEPELVAELKKRLLEKNAAH